MSPNTRRLLPSPPVCLFQLWRNIWGLDTPPCLEARVKQRDEGWMDKLIAGEANNLPKEKRARIRAAVDGMVDKVTKAVRLPSLLK